MTSDRLREILALLHWSGRGLAAVVACDERLVRRWTSGTHRVPEAIAKWLETLAAVHAANPAPSPADWRQRDAILPA